MSQVLHIFKKDARHLWAEILVSLVVTALFVKLYPHTWLPGFHDNRMIDIAANVVTALVPVTWWLMLTRLVQSESLVGERQFWITRPYQWQKLLAAKFLFLTIFIYGPILVAHIFLLRSGGFHPFSYLYGLFFNVLLITLVILAPVVAIAAITPSFGIAVLWLLGVTAFIVGLAASASSFNSTNPNTFGDTILPIVFCTLSLAVVLVQYATRNVRLSRWLLLAMVATALLSVFPWPGSALVPLEYPIQSRTAAPAHIEFASGEEIEARAGRNEKEIALQFPITVSGTAAGQTIQIEGAKIDIVAPNGLHWSSFWQYGGHLSSEGASVASVDVDRQFLERVKDLPVQVKLTWAVSRIRATSTRQTSIRDGDFMIPNGGICAVPQDQYISSVECRFPMRKPRLNNFTAQWSLLPCSEIHSPDNKFQSDSGWEGSLDTAPADLGITPVWTSSLYFPAQAINSIRSSDRASLCPGTPVTFTEYELVDRARLQLLISQVHLPFQPAPVKIFTRNGE